MNRRSGTFAAATAAIVLSLMWVATARGQGPLVPRAPMADKVFKNVQVLKGVPVDEFMGMMGIFAAAVGRGCNECHAFEASGDWARYADDTPLKQTARRMVLMMRQINRTNFGGRQLVTCYSCSGEDGRRDPGDHVLRYGDRAADPVDALRGHAGRAHRHAVRL